MKNQSLKKRISILTFFLLLIFFTPLFLQSKDSYKLNEFEEESLITCPTNLTTFLAPPVTVTNSQCTAVGGTVEVAEGEINGLDPSEPQCPTGSRIQYRTGNSEPWINSLPLYDQVTETNVYTRCICETDNAVVSLVNVVITDPATCPGGDGCPIGLSSSLAPPVEITDRSCTASGIVSDGQVSSPITRCPDGSMIQYSLDEIVWGELDLRDLYNQTNSITIYTRCRCDFFEETVSLTRAVVTIPGECIECPSDLSTTLAPSVSIINSTCTVVGGTPTGGILSAPTIPCPTGSSLQYSINNGTTWSTTLPDYSQNTAITVLTRCICDIDNSVTSIVNSTTTIPGTCPISMVNIPTMSEWGLIIFGLLILNVGLIILYRLEGILV